MKNGRSTLDDYGDLLTVAELSHWRRTSKNSTYADIAAGRIPVLRFGPGGRIIRIAKAQLQNLCLTPPASNHDDQNVLEAVKK